MLKTVALIGIILATYIYIVKTILRNFSKSSNIISLIFWGLLLLATLSFLFSSDNNSNSQNNYSNYCSDSDDEIYDIEDDFTSSLLEENDDNYDYYDD